MNVSLKWYLLVIAVFIKSVVSNHDENQRFCRLHRIVHTIEQPDCETKRFLSLACRGHCHSYTMYSSESGQVERQCSCCQASGKVERHIQLLCKSGAQSTFRMMLPTGCMCRPCSDQGVNGVPDYVNPTDLQSSVADLIDLS